MPFETSGYELAPWQERAVEAWQSGAGRPNTGTLEIFTGGGKTLMALECVSRVSQSVSDLQVAVVVPTVALAEQWVDAIERHLEWVDRVPDGGASGSSDQPTIPGLADDPKPAERRRLVGVMGGGGKASLGDVRVLVCVLNTAAKRLPSMVSDRASTMIVVDECHRAGAKFFSRVLDTPADFRLGLSATPEREEVDEDGEPITFDEQLVGQKLGEVVHRFTLRDARSIGWLPDYVLNHQAVRLHEEERQKYESLTRQIDEAADQLRELGGDTLRARQLSGREGQLGEAAIAYVGLTSRRKDLLYRARERGRVAAALVRTELERGANRILCFHERVDEAAELHRVIVEALPDVEIRLEHSRLPKKERTASLEDFRSGAAQVLVSVKSLVEGIDVPEADVGISVASSSSVRQRVQSLGRVLRRSFGDEADKKSARMHLLYVHDTVDDLIYGKEDWEDLTGEGSNNYWLWPLDPADPPERLEGPPRSPLPTEEQEWERLGGRVPSSPERWLGVVTGHEYSVDTMGNVHNMGGTAMSNPQGAPDAVEAVRGRKGGRFRVTPMHRLLLVGDHRDDDFSWYVAGALSEPFRSIESEVAESAEEAVDAADLHPGDEIPGAPDKSGGTFQIKQTRGGVIARKVKGGVDMALTSDSGTPELEDNARRVLDAWRSLMDRGTSFNVDGNDIAWYAEAGSRRYLAHVPGGFAWPD